MKASDLLTVGEVSQRSGIAPSALRYYEAEGLISATRTTGNQRRYRRSVLEPGASKPAAELVKDFLGRPQSLDAMKTWMNEHFETKGTKSTGK